MAMDITDESTHENVYHDDTPHAEEVVKDEMSELEANIESASAAASAADMAASKE
jgi:hypothetical protein